MYPHCLHCIPTVAPYTGAWIEIGSAVPTVMYGVVAPYTGAWIEIATDYVLTIDMASRSLHGSVD